MSENFLIGENINVSDSEIKNQIESISDNTMIDFPQNLDLKKIKDLNNKCSELIIEEKVEDGLKILKKIELFLESNIMDKKLNFEKKLLVIILHNISCCHQKLKELDNCISYLESVIYHYDFSLENRHNIKINEEYLIQHIKESKDNYSSLGDLILELRYSAKFHLQMSAILSEANRHAESLKYARLASIICEDNIVKTNYLFHQIRDKQIKNGFSNNNNSEENSNLLNDKIKLNYKIINELYNLIINSRNYNTKNKPNSFSNNLVIKNENNSEKNNNKFTNFNSYLNYRESEINKYNRKISFLNKIRYIFGGINQEDWIQLLNIENILYLSPLNSEDLDLDSDSRFELLKDTILEKVVMLTVSYFCISREMKILCKEKNNKKVNGEYFLNQAVELSSLFFPSSCPIINYYISNYYKSYGQNMEIVPEGKILDLKINLIRSEFEQNKETLSFIKLDKINYSNKIQNNKNYLNNSNNNTVFKNVNINNILIPRLNINNNLNNNNINVYNIKNITNVLINKENKINDINNKKIINFTDANNTSNLSTNRNLNRNENNNKIDNKKKTYKSCEKKKKKKIPKKSKTNKPLSSNSINMNNNNSNSNKSTKTMKFIKNYNINKSKGSHSNNNSKNKNNEKNDKGKFKNAMKINLNLNIKHNNYDLLPNKNFLNFAKKSKINENLAPKFKLNFANLNKSENEENDTNDFACNSNINSMNNLKPKSFHTSKKNTKMNVISDSKNKNISNKKPININLEYNFLLPNGRDAKTERIKNPNKEIEIKLYNKTNKINKAKINISLGRKNINLYPSSKNNYSSLLMKRKEIKGNKTERILNRNDIRTKKINHNNKINDIRIKFNSPQLQSKNCKTYRYFKFEINKKKNELNNHGDFSFLNNKNKNNKNINSLRYQYVNCTKKKNSSKSYFNNSNNNSNSNNKEGMIKSMDVINRYLFNTNKKNFNFASENVSFQKLQPFKNKINLNKHHLNDNLVTHFKNMKF